jgi:hypothetical protein
MISRRTWRLGALTGALMVRSALGQAQAISQPSMVPATHPVYDWLYEQRLAGRIPTYTYEQRPMTRGTIAAHLAKVAQDSASLSPIERHLLRDFLNEFDMRRLVANRAFTKETFAHPPGSIIRAIIARRDPVLYAGFSGDSTVSGAIWAARGRGWAYYDLDDKFEGGYTSSKAARLFLNTTWGVGWHFEIDNLYSYSVRDLVLQNPRYGGELVKPGETGAYQYDTWGTYKAKWLEVAMGRGAQALGPAITDPLVLREGAPFFGTLRAVIGTPKLNLTYLHSTLFAPTTIDTILLQGQPIATRVSPERHLVQQRINYQPIDRLSLTAWSSIVYSNRAVDLDYLNPVLPLFFAQNIMKGDRDNLLIGGDAVVRPWHGTEVFGSLLIDDAGLDGKYKGAKSIGIQQRLLPGLRLGAGYTATDPEAYTHWQQLNAYSEHDKFLGPEFGPNAEELSARLTAWLPLRTRLMVGVRSQKLGLNPVDSLGDVVSCAGGGLQWCDGSSPWVMRSRFAGADVQVVHRFEAEAYTELIRGVPLIFSVRDDRVVKGTQLKSNYYMEVRYRYGY